MRIPIDRLLIAIALFVASSTFIYFLVTLGDDSGEPVLNLPAAAAPTSTPVVAAIPTVVVPPAPAPEATAVRPLVITPSPTPEPSAAELEERDVLAPWVYYFPTKWVPDAAEWPEAYRWQDPLPTIEPPLDWKYDTYRTPYPTFGGGYRDRPFIVGINADEPFGLFPGSLMGALETLTPQLDRDMRAIFKTHHEIIPLWAQAIATLDTREVAPLIAQQAPVVLAQVTGELRDAGVGAQASPHAHEIIAMAIGGDRAEVLQVYRSADGTYYDIDTGLVVYGVAPGDSRPSGATSYTYAQWQRIDGRWIETSVGFSADYPGLTPAQWLVERSPWLVPYIELWEAAFAQEAVSGAEGG